MVRLPESSFSGFSICITERLFSAMDPYGSGKYMDTANSTGSTDVSRVVVTTDPRQVAAIDRLNDHLDRGILAVISYDHDVTERSKIASIQQDASK